MADVSSWPGTCPIVDRYPNIADRGLIGDLQTADLVTTTEREDYVTRQHSEEIGQTGEQLGNQLDHGVGVEPMLAGAR